jgi:hypothetical protein
MWNAECGMEKNGEVGIEKNAEVGMRNAEWKRMGKSGCGRRKWEGGKAWNWGLGIRYWGLGNGDWVLVSIY